MRSREEVLREFAKPVGRAMYHDVNAMADRIRELEAPRGEAVACPRWGTCFSHDCTCHPPVAAVVSEDAQRLDAIRDNAWTLTPFDMPTGGGDADIGWAVTEMHVGINEPVQVAIVYEDDPRKAITAALTAARGGA